MPTKEEFEEFLGELWEIQRYGEGLGKWAWIHPGDLYTKIKKFEEKHDLKGKCPPNIPDVILKSLDDFKR